MKFHPLVLPIFLYSFFWGGDEERVGKTFPVVAFLKMPPQRGEGKGKAWIMKL